MYLMRFLIDRKYPFIFLFNSIEVSVSVLAAQDLCFSLLNNHIPQKEIWFFWGEITSDRNTEAQQPLIVPSISLLIPRSLLALSGEENARKGW